MSDALQDAKGAAELASKMAGELVGHQSDTALVLAQIAAAQAMIALVERLDAMTADRGSAQPAIRVLAYSPAGW